MTQAQILLALVSAIILSWITFSFILIGNVTNAQESSNSSSYSLNGIVGSLILDISPFSDNLTTDINPQIPFNITTVPKFILAGDWDIKLHNIGNNNGIINNSNTSSHNNNLKVVDLTADFIGITTDGKGTHTHQISNFTPIPTVHPIMDKTNYSNSNSSFFSEINVLDRKGDAHIVGIVDVGINNHKIWAGVKADIIVSNGKTIEIRLDDKAVGFHFGKGQAIYGLVNGLYSNY